MLWHSHDGNLVFPNMVLGFFVRIWVFRRFYLFFCISKFLACEFFT